MRKANTPLAIIFSVSAALVYACLALLIQYAEAGLSNSMLVFFRQLIGFCCFLPFMAMNNKKNLQLKTNQLSLYLLRTFCNLSAMFCFYFALRYLPLTDAVLLSYTRPLFIPIIVYFWFHKKWNRPIWYGLFMGFIGVLIILKPDHKLFDIAALIGLASALFGAIAFTTLRRLTKTESSKQILFYYFTLSIPIAAVPLLVNWTNPTLNQWGLLCLIGLGGALYQILLTRAYQCAKAFKVGSLLYSSVIFAWIFDQIIGKQAITWTPLLGIFLIIFGSITALKEETS